VPTLALPDVPRELEKVSHPTYVIEPPDILLIDAARLVPRPPYRVEPLDALFITVTDTLPKQPIEGIYSVDTAGAVNLGFNYGSVTLFGKTLDEAKAAIYAHLKDKLKLDFEVYVSVAETRALQQVRGEHLVRQDGTVGLGTYGSVYVTGLTIAQAKAAIEDHLSRFLFQPKVSVDVAGFNSHVYFIIFDFPGAGGQSLYRRPITGNETVLDALSEYSFGRGGGLPPGVSKRRIWVARPAPAKCGATQILPVDWAAITRKGNTATNYQLLPGDRIYVAQDPCAAVDVALARIFAPVERVFGITLFGNSVIQNLINSNNTGATGTR
jgi:polysaccharide export outer membrane protein